MIRRIEPLVVGVLIALALIGVTVYILALPPATAVMFRISGSGAESGLEPEVALETAEEVRAYVVGSGRSLPVEVDRREGFTTDAVSHLDDVQVVFGVSMWLTALCLLLSTAWAFVRSRAGKSVIVRAAATWAGRFVLGGAAVAFLIAFVDFDRFFAGFHSLFFEAGTWRFPADDLLIQLFPEPFWVLAGALWGAMVLLGGIGLMLYGRGSSRVRARNSDETGA